MQRPLAQHASWLPGLLLGQRMRDPTSMLMRRAAMGVVQQQQHAWKP